MFGFHVISPAAWDYMQLHPDYTPKQAGKPSGWLSAVCKFGINVFFCYNIRTYPELYRGEINRHQEET
jgi:hypothetical protein